MNREDRGIFPADPGFHKPRHKCCGGTLSTSLIVGGLFIVVGTLLLLDRFGLVEARHMLSYWPAVLLAFGLVALLTRGRDGVVPGSVMTVAGAVLLSNRLGWTEFGLRDLWPAILILVGILVLVNSLRARRPSEPLDESGPGDAGNVLKADFLNDGAFFGGVEKKVESQNFRGGDVNAIFGGVVVNLRHARITRKGPAILNANAIFGGVELHVPEDWRVVIEATAILGGFADTRRFVESRDDLIPDDRPQLIVRGMALFGGVDIKN